MKTVETSVELTPAQLSFFAGLAKAHKASAGEVLLALACDRIESNPTEDHPSSSLAGRIKQFARSRISPEMDREWLRLIVERLGGEKRRLRAG